MEDLKSVESEMSSSDLKRSEAEKCVKKITKNISADNWNSPLVSTSGFMNEYIHFLSVL